MNDEQKDKFGISIKEAREAHERMRLRFPELPITPWKGLAEANQGKKAF